MSRQIDLSQPLSDDDRQYLLDRGRHADIARADGTGEWAPPDDSLPGAREQSPHATDASVGAQAQNADQQGTPEPTDADGSGADSDEPEGDNYDDETAWSYKDLQEEVKDAEADDKPALNSSREVLVAWLRDYDAAN